MPPPPPGFEAISSVSINYTSTMKTLRVDAFQTEAVRLVELCTSLATETFYEEISRYHSLIFEFAITSSSHSRH